MPTARVNGVDLFYEDVGEGTPIVFVHEFAGEARSWHLQVRFFARRYRTIAYNARGYPPSDVPEDPKAYSQDQAADDIRGLLDALGIRKAHICGLSRGGYATLHFGLRYPERALSLVVAGAGYGSVAGERDHQRQRALGIAEPEVKRRVAAHAEPADVRLPDAESVEQPANVVRGLVLGIRLGVFWHVRGRVTARVVGDGAVAAGEVAHLEVPAPRLARELVDEDERRPLAHLLIEEADPVDLRCRHGGSLLQTAGPLNRERASAQALRSTSTFITGPPRSACSMPSWSPSSGILWLTSGPTGTAPEAARRIASSQSARA